VAAEHTPAIKFERFTCWRNPQAPPVLRGLDLEIPHGQVVLLLGPSGSGKTTLGLTLNGIIPQIQGAVEGKVYVDGLDVAETPISALSSKVGIVFQDVENQLVMVYVRDEVAFGPENLKVPTAEVQQRVKETLEFVGLVGMDDRFVFELSGGQKQKVALASVLSMQPMILFLDEPTANLDPRSSREVFDLVARLRERHTVIIFDHKVDDLASAVDRVIVLDGGGVAFDAPPRELFETQGAALVGEHGLWIPQAAEIELQLRQRSGVASPVFPLTVDDAVEQYRRLRFAPLPRANVERAPASETALIRTQGVSHVYTDGPAAIRDVSVEIRRGERVAIVGPNGSGKTTLVKHFVGLLKPTTGDVLINGQSTRKLSTREIAREIGFVFQYPEHQFVADTVQDELAFSLRVAGVPDEEIGERVREQLHFFRLEGYEQRHPYTLSGGEKRRLSVATMLVAQPHALILDEPTYGQDKANTIRMMSSLFESAAARDEALTLLLVTHDMKLVAMYAERAIVMRAGQVAYDGPVAELFRHEQLLADANLEEPPLYAIAERLRRLGHDVPPIVSVEEFVASIVALEAIGEERSS